MGKYLITIYYLIAIINNTASFAQNMLSVTAYGATGNDTSDDTGPIKQTISAAKTQGKTVFIPAGTFYHKEFTLDGVSMTGECDSTSILYAFDPDNNTIFVRGSGVTISNVQIKSASSVRTAVDWPLFIDKADDFVINKIIVDGGNSGGILNYGGSNGKIINSLVKNTLADGIHNSEGAHDIIVANNTVRNTGDDFIAVVSYDSAGIVRNILIRDNDVAENDWGRGITSVGSSDITIEGNKIGRTGWGAGILIATEPSYNSPPLSNILVRNNQFSYNSGNTGHGAFLISGLNGNIDKIRFEGNTIIEPVHDAIKTEGAVTNIAIINNTIIDSDNGGINIVNGSNIYCSGNTLNGNTTSSAGCSGANNFSVAGSTLSYVPIATVPCRTTTGLINWEIENLILIYPNPLHANSMLTILQEVLLKDAAMEIYDVYGKEMKSVPIVKHEILIDCDELPSSVYFYYIVSDNKRIASGKIIIL